jgi:hypothetical protein
MSWDRKDSGRARLMIDNYRFGGCVNALNVEGFAPSRAASLADGSRPRDSQSASAVPQLVPQSVLAVNVVDEI